MADKEESVDQNGITPGQGEQELIPIVSFGTTGYLCFQCIADFKALNSDATEEDMMAGFGTPDAHVYSAITLVPSWQQKQMGPSLIVSVIAVPICFAHIAAREQTPEERAIAGGHILPGSPGFN